jgi:hypothetical protein
VSSHQSITAIRVPKEHDKGHVDRELSRDISSPKCGLWLFNMFVNHNFGPRTPKVQAQRHQTTVCDGQVFRLHIIGTVISSPPPIRPSHNEANKIFSYTPKEVTTAQRAMSPPHSGFQSSFLEVLAPNL